MADYDGLTPGQVLADASVAEFIKTLGLSIAEAQQALDENSVDQIGEFLTPRPSLGGRNFPISGDDPLAHIRALQEAVTSDTEAGVPRLLYEHPDHAFTISTDAEPEKVATTDRTVALPANTIWKPSQSTAPLSTTLLNTKELEVLKARELQLNAQLLDKSREFTLTTEKLSTAQSRIGTLEADLSQTAAEKNSSFTGTGRRGLATRRCDCLGVGEGVASAQQALDEGSLAAVLDLYAESDDAKMKLLQDIGYRPTFYALPDTTGEVRVALHMGQGAAGTRSATAVHKTATPAVLATLGRRGLNTSQKLYASPVDAGYSNQYGFNADVSAKLTFRIVPIPPPDGVDELRLVPDLTGRSLTDARTALEQLGLTGALSSGDNNETDQSRLVTAQDPAADSIVRSGDVIVLTLAE